MILLISPKTVYATKRLLEEAAKLNIGMEVMDVEDLVAKNFEINVEKYSVLFVRQPYLNGSPKYLPNIIELAKKFRAAGKRVIDAVIAEGHLGEGKWEDYEKLRKGGLPIPATKQLTINNLQLTYPSILKWIYGFKGRGVFLVKNETDVNRVLKTIPAEELMVQEFIDSDFEYKVMTVGYKALPVILKVAIDEKTSKPDFSTAGPIYWRHSERTSPDFREESLSEDEIPRRFTPQDDAVLEIISLAERASKVLKRELSKIDILQKGNQLYILEVNRWPGLNSFEKLTKYNVAGEFVKYLLLD